MARAANSFTFFRDNYVDYETKEFQEYDYYADIATLMRMLLKNKYQIRVWDDDYCVVLEYDHADAAIAENELKWIGENEYVESYGGGEPYGGGAGNDEN